MSSSVGGYQKKYYIESEDLYVKEDTSGGEALTEVLISEFLGACSNVNYLKYDFYNGDLRACASKNFLTSSTYFVSFLNFCEMFSLEFDETRSLEDQYNFILQSVLCRVSLDKVEQTKLQLNQMFYLDMMFRNVDRHLANFGFIVDIRKESFDLAPIFDNGGALGQQEGLYWDWNNLVKGWGFSIKPWNCTINDLEDFFSECPFDFDVDKFIRQHVSLPNIDTVNKVFSAFLNLIIRYIPYDSNGKDVKSELESAFGQKTLRKPR